ncbi:Omp28-related outer membrane protein [Flavobacterium hauense]
MKKNLILIVATLLVIIGCSTDYEILQSQDKISLTADASVKKIGETVTFTVKNSKGEILTENAEFFVDGTKIEGNTFTSDVVGNFEVTAIYNTVTSAPLMVNYHDGTGINFRKRMLIEDYTGTWCGWCPRVAHAIDLVHNQTEDAIAVAIHGPGATPSETGYDPYTYNTKAFEKEAGLAPGYPKGYLNRNIQWEFPEPDNVNQAIALTQGENPKLGVAMTSAIANGTITMDVNVMFGKDFGNKLKLVVYVLENGLIYEQHNYTSYYDGVDLLEDYEHNHVLREVLTPMTGEAISADQTKIGNTFTRTFSVAVPANIANAANVEFVAFVLDETGRVINVRKTAPGETQEIELL